MAIRRSLETLLRTAIGVSVLPIPISLYCLAAIALAGASAARSHRLYVSICRVCRLVRGTKLVVHGVERIETGRAFVVVPDHEARPRFEFRVSVRCEPRPGSVSARGSTTPAVMPGTWDQFETHRLGVRNA